MQKVTIILLVVFLGFLSASCKSALQRDAETRVQTWFGESFVKCGEDHFAKFHSEVFSIYVTEYGTSAKKGLMQFKNLSFVIEEQPLTSTEKLNGIEWHGGIVLKCAQWRYHNGEKWSPWSDMLLVYSDDLSKAANNLLNRPNTPLFVSLEKAKGEWSGLGTYWRKPTCSELPAL